MAEITWKFPSSIQYGQMKMVFTVDDDDLNFDDLGYRYAQAVKKFRDGEEAAAKDEREAASKAAPAVPKGKRKVETVKLPDEPATATQDLTPEDAAKLISETLGATVMDESVYDAPVPEPAKPWQNAPSFDFDN